MISKATLHKNPPTPVMEDVFAGDQLVMGDGGYRRALPQENRDSIAGEAMDAGTIMEGEIGRPGFAKASVTVAELRTILAAFPDDMMVVTPGFDETGIAPVRTVLKVKIRKARHASDPPGQHQSAYENPADYGEDGPFERFALLIDF